MPRGELRFSFRYSDIAKAAGEDEETVRKARKSGDLDPKDLTSIVDWAAGMRAWRAAQERAARRTGARR